MSRPRSHEEDTLVSHPPDNLGWRTTKDQLRGEAFSLSPERWTDPWVDTNSDSDPEVLDLSASQPREEI